MFKKLLITGGIALAGYVINEVRKQYDKNARFVTETQTRQDGSIQTVKHDRATGFTIFSSKDA